MDDKIQGVVLQSLRYGDSSLIVKVLTRNAGLRSYMVKGALNHGAKNRTALFQSLNIIQYVEAGKPSTAALGYLKEVQLSCVYQSLPFEMNKRAVMLYVSELLSKMLTGQEQNVELYDFVVQSLQWLDLVESHYANFPLYFTLELTRYLGFYPQMNHLDRDYFDMMEGSFVRSCPVHPYYFEPEMAHVFNALLGLGIDEACRLPLPVEQRRDLLEGIIVFMRLHAPLMNGFRSHEVLKEVLQ